MKLLVFGGRDFKGRDFVFRTLDRAHEMRQKDEFSRFLETVERIAAQAGVFIPLERAA